MCRLIELRTSINDTARVVRSNILFLLIVGLYIGVLVFHTTDLQLLKEENIILPIMQVDVPIITFYSVAPILFLLVHFNLILRLSQLSEAIGLLNDRIEQRSYDEQKWQRSLIFPSDFARLILKTEEQRIGKCLLLLVTIISIAILPIFLLLSILMQFLKYQNELITLLHQIIVTSDLLMLTYFMIWLVRHFRIIPQEIYWYRCLFTGGITWLSWPIFAILLVMLTLVWSVATVPHSVLERYIGWRWASAVAFGDRWGEFKFWRQTQTGLLPGGIFPFRRYLSIHGIIAKEKPTPEEIGGLRAGGMDIARAWDNVSSLDLTDRTFRYANFRRAKFINADMSFARLDGADLSYAELVGVSLSYADLIDVNLNHSDLSGSSLLSARLYGANLEEAKLYATDLTRTRLYGANLFRAKLYGTDLSHSTLDGANLREALLYGSILRKTQLHGAYLHETLLRLVNLKHISQEIDGWPKIEEDIRSSLYWSGYRKSTIDHLVNEIHEDYDGHSERLGLNGLNYQPISDECVWHKNTGPTEGWPTPEPNCVEKLRELLTRIACQNTSTASAIVNWIDKRWIDSLIRDNLVNVVSDKCSALDLHRDYIRRIVHEKSMEPKHRIRMIYGR